MEEAEGFSSGLDPTTTASRGDPSQALRGAGDISNSICSDTISTAQQALPDARRTFRIIPTLKREDCREGSDLAKELNLQDNQSVKDLSGTENSSNQSGCDGQSHPRGHG